MDYAEIERLTARVKEENVIVGRMKSEMGRAIIGQDNLIDRIIIASITGGHILLEGLPGLAKTLTVRAFSRVIDSEFKRVQFTPDLLPADLIGTRIFNPGDMNFSTKKGPIFTSILLADEINRAPAKVQSALLQAMEEKQVTIGDERFRDINIDVLQAVVTPARLEETASLVDSIYLDEKLIGYIVSITGETRRPARKELKRYIDFGASPRASICLMKAARCVAFMRGRGFVTPDDVKEIGADVLRHRIILSYEAEADGKTADDVVKMVFDSVQVP
jgi:MoxR-like ATPase